MSGNGTFVDVTEDHVDEMAAGMAGGQNLLVDKYNQTFNLVDTTKAQVEGFITELNSLLAEVAMPNGWEDLLGAVQINSVPGIDMNSVPEIGGLNLPGFTGVNFPLHPALKTAPSVDLGYDTPTKPTEVNPVLNYTITPYNSEMWLTLFSKVHNGILSGGDGLSAAAEAAQHARAAERNRKSNEKAYLAARREIESRGARFPQIALRALEAEMAAEVLAQEYDSSNAIVISQAELRDTNMRFLIEKGVQLEQILRDFYKTYETLDLEAKKAAADLLLRNYAEKVKAYIAHWQGISAEMKAKVDVVNVVIAENQTLIEGFKAETEGAIAKTEQISKERQSLVDAHKADAIVYEAKVRAQTAWYGALSENQKAQLEKAKLELEKAIQQVKAKLDSTVSVNALREKILEAMSNISAQVLASALNAVNTSIGHSTSASENRSETFSNNASITEAHTFDETKTS